jgi:hypothetical protein
MLAGYDIYSGILCPNKLWSISIGSLTRTRLTYLQLEDLVCPRLHGVRLDPFDQEKVYPSKMLAGMLVMIYPGILCLVFSSENKNSDTFPGILLWWSIWICLCCYAVQECVCLFLLSSPLKPNTNSQAFLGLYMCGAYAVILRNIDLCGRLASLLVCCVWFLRSAKLVLYFNPLFRSSMLRLFRLFLCWNILLNFL